jgi:hypothetical protein
MRSIFCALCVSLVAAIVSLAPASSSPLTGEFQLARAPSGICCERGPQHWFTTSYDCRRRHGTEVERRFCEKNVDRVCCHHDGRNWWTTQPKCRHDHGKEVEKHLCPHLG